MDVHIPSQPSPEQLQLLQRPPRPVEIIKGAAGSGKTYTAAYKLMFAAIYMATNKDNVNVQILSFNRTLRGYINKMMLSYEEKYGLNERIYISIDTFAKWALSSLDMPERCVSANDFLREKGAALPLRSLFSQDFLAEEMAYILKRFPHDALGNYVPSTRYGRGTSPVIDERTRQVLLHDYVAGYIDWKRQNDFFDWEDVAWKAATELPKDYDIIVVDEGQDFTANQYRAVVNSLKEDSCLICVIDTAQKIYLNGFTWAECGINATQYSPYSLTRNFRNPREVARLAAKLLEDVHIDEDGVRPEQGSPDAPSSVPVLLIGRFSEQMDYIIEKIPAFLARGESCAILFKSQRWSDYATQRLREANLDFLSITRESEWPDDDVNLVISTMHSAKGLEFDHVFMPGINNVLFPSSYPGGDEAVQQDRRLLAMAIGRARKTVTLGEKSGEESCYFTNMDESILRRIHL